MNFTTYLEGFTAGAGLIIAIGAQNAFVLRQGILRRYRFTIAAICSLIDIFLISAGVLGLGAVITGIPLLMTIVTIGGALFLLIYGIRSFLSAWKPKVLEEETGAGNSVGNFRAVVLTLLAFSLLNPHVYLDTVLLLGSIGARHPEGQRFSFIAGTSTASVCWFFGLSYGSSLLTPLFKKKITWRILDLAVGGVMLWIAWKLIQYAIKFHIA